MMLEGAPLTKECISELVSSFSAEQSHMPAGKIPSNLLFSDNRIGHKRYLWYNPPMQRMMYFSKNLNMEDGLYFVPGVIYVAESDKLNIYAFKGRKPVDRLYQAPFFNVSGASVCLGNASIEYPEDPGYEALMHYWERKFWMTEFSHLGGSRNPTKNNLYTVTKNWKERFDYNELVTSKTTLKDLLK